MKQATVRLQSIAEGDLENIARFYAEHSEATARRVIADIEDTLDTLRIYPNVGRNIEDDIQQLVTPRYRHRIIYNYDASENIVSVSAILGQQDR